MAEAIVCVPVDRAGQVGASWGKAEQVAVASIDGGQVREWRPMIVDWDTLHDTGMPGSHHARVARFIQEHGVTDVVARHMGEPMRVMLGKLGVRVHLDADGDARAAVLRV